MGVKITDMTTAGALVGTELIPSSISNAPRSLTPADIKTFTVDQIEAIAAATSTTGADSVFLLQGGVLKPIDIDLVAQHAINTVWGKALEAAPDAADVMAVKDGGTTEKTITLLVLAEYVRATIEAAVLDVSDLADGSGALAVGDYMLVTQGTTAKRIQVSDLNTAIYAGLAAHVAGKGAISSPVDADELYVVRSGTPYKITLAQIATHAAASATVSGSGTTDFLTQWSSSSVLKAGPGIVLGATGFAAGADTGIPTTSAVRKELSELINDQTDIGADLVLADTFLVDDGAAGTAQRKSTFTRLKKLMETSGVYKTLFVPAGAMVPSVTSGAAAATVEWGTNDITQDVMTFAGLSADDNAEFGLVMPEAWDRGTVKYKVYWTNGDAAANAAEYVGFSLAAGAISNDDALDAALGSGVAVEDQLIADDDLHVTAASGALTVGGSPALGDMVQFKLTRDFDYAGAGAAMDVDAYVLGVLVQYRENLEVAAW